MSVEELNACQIAFQLAQTRNELNNIRKGLQSIKAQHKGDVERLNELLVSAKDLQEIHSPKLQLKNSSNNSGIHNSSTSSDPILYHLKPIGTIRSVHRQKNGTPRQGSVSKLSRGKLEIDKAVFNNPIHSLKGLDSYSHIWLIYIFHENKSNGSHATVAPPRLDGKKLGVFSTRSPHRPNAIGLTLAKLEKVEGNILMLSGLDILDGTPAVDIKPYIPFYDTPVISQSRDQQTSINIENSSQINDCEEEREVSQHTVVELDRIGSEATSDPVVSRSEYSNIFANSEDNYVDYLNSEYLYSLVNEEISCQGKKENFNKTLNIDTNINCPTLTEKESDNANLENVSLTAKYKNIQQTILNVHFPITEEELAVASWVKNPPIASLEVIFNPIAEKQLELFSKDAENPQFRLEYLLNHTELRAAISSVLAEDPRSSYRRQKCSDRLYFFMVDSAHITAWFFDGVAEVLRVFPSDKAVSGFKLV